MGSRQPRHWRRHVTIVRTAAWLTALAVFWSQPTSTAGAAAASDCTTEAKVLSKEQSELPRLDVASPKDRPPYCLTLETILAVGGRGEGERARCARLDFRARG